MKMVFTVSAIAFLFYTLPSQAWWLVSANSSADVVVSGESHDAWLKKRFSDQHQQLIPIVAVADIFFSCNRERKVDPISYNLDDLINDMPKNTLAEKLSLCLGEDTMQSDKALNFGLVGCFHGQLAHLPEEERVQKMHLVRNSITLLSHAERKKSFTQCVTEQSIHYLK